MLKLRKVFGQYPNIQVFYLEDLRITEFSFDFIIILNVFFYLYFFFGCWIKIILFYLIIEVNRRKENTYHKQSNGFNDFLDFY